MSHDRGPLGAMTASLEIASRSLGRSGLAIPQIALGCGNFGGIGSAPEFFGRGLDDQQALELMDAAWELGITHFDTADAYGGGHSEEMIGRWIGSRGYRPTPTTKNSNPQDPRRRLRWRPQRGDDRPLDRLAGIPTDADHEDLQPDARRRRPRAGSRPDPPPA